MSIYDVQSQRGAYAAEELGTVPSATIGGYGCFITAAAMIATHFLGRLVTPHEINQSMKARGLYQQGDMFPDAALQSLFPSIQFQWQKLYPGPADLSQLAMGNDEERLVGISAPDLGFPLHALRAYSWDGKTLIVDDPWYGTRGNFTVHYGSDLRKRIVSIAGYRVPGWVPPWATQPPPVVPPIIVVPPVVPTADPKDQLIADLRSQVATFQLQLQTSVTGENALKIGFAKLDQAFMEIKATLPK